MDENWILLLASGEQHQIQIFKSMLESNQIPAIILNKQDSAYLAFGDIELYVPRDKFVQARYLIDRSSND